MTPNHRRLRTALAHVTAALSDVERTLPPTPDSYRAVILPLRDARQRLLELVTKAAKTEATR